MDKLTAMRSYRRVIELGAFAAAARDVGLSKAAVSKQIAQLEATLGVALISRTTRQLVATEAGRSYYEHCVRILEDIGEAELSISEMQQKPRGTLRVNAPMSFGLTHVSPLVPTFAARYPEVRIELSMDDRPIDLIQEGFDVALRGRSSLPDSSLIARRIAPLRRVVCASPGYIEHYGFPQCPMELSQHRCLIYSLSSSPREWVLMHNSTGIEARVEVDGFYVANNSIALRHALLADAGVALIPTFLVGDDLRSGVLVPLLDEYTPLEQTLWALYPFHRYVPTKVRCFIDFLVEVFGDTPPWEKVREGQGS